MKHLHVSWDEYHRLIEQLIIQVHESGWEFDQIVCIARGGLRIGDVFSRVCDRPLAILSTTSYREGSGTVQGQLVISENMAMTIPTLGTKILLVDDMVDSGITLEAVKACLAERHSSIKEIRTAVLWHKGVSVFKPDYRVEYLPDNPWIHQPFELYDTLRPNDLSEKNKN